MAPKLVAVGFFLGLLGGVVGRAAEAPPAYSDENVDLIRELMRRRGGDPAALAQLVQLTRPCSPEKTAELFEVLARAHRRAGDLNLAAATQQLLVERFPDQPAARRALLWLVRSYASGEVGRAHRPPPQAATAGGLTLVPREETTIQASAETANEAPGGTTAPEAALPTYALYLAAQAEAIRPALAHDPPLVFQRAAAARRAGQAKAAQGFLVSLKHARAGDAWGGCARMETWLAERPDAPPPKPVVSAAAAAAPHLDGVLGEPCWRGEGTSLGDARAWLAYDDAYLYLAVSCPQAAGVEYPRDLRPRPHDGDVAAFDHVRVLLDVDRDYATWFELVVDSRGWTADRAWGDARWNPQWFVAAGEASGAWTAEAAIPLAGLVDRPPRKGDAWACRLERRLPSQGRQTWPGGVRSDPNGLGVLLFD
jgi:hypothetical protein